MRKFAQLALLLPLISLVVVSCKQEKPGPAKLLVINAAISSPVAPNPLPTAGPAVDVRWNGRLVFNNVLYGAASVGGTPVTTITNPLVVNAAYRDVETGGFGLNMALAGGAGTTIYDRTTSFLPESNYTAVTFNFTPFYNVLLMKDDLTPPPPGKVKIRFIHAVPQEIFTSLGVPRRDTVDVTATGGLSTAPVQNLALFPLRRFADAYNNLKLQEFAVIDSGRYNLGLRVAGTPGTSPATGLLALLPLPPANTRLEAGKIYTVVARLQFAAPPNPPAPALTIVAHN